MDKIDFETAFRGLMSAIILQALEDANQTRQPRVRREALAWLKSSECADYLEWLELVDVDLDSLLEAVKAQPCLRKPDRGHTTRTSGGRPPRRTTHPRLTRRSS